jgi:hypothetical protein
LSKDEGQQDWEGEDERGRHKVVEGGEVEALVLLQPSERVNSEPLLRKMSGAKKSVQLDRNENKVTVIRPPLAMGSTTRNKIAQSPAPSTRAASISSPGNDRKNCRSRKMARLAEKAEAMY